MGVLARLAKGDLWLSTGLQLKGKGMFQLVFLYRISQNRVDFLKVLANVPLEIKKRFSSVTPYHPDSKSSL